MTKDKPIAIHIHSFSLRFQFKYRDDFDVFSFIEFAQQQGFTGVNISANGPGYRDLSGTTEAHFKAVRECLKMNQMNAELDTSDTREENLSTMLDVADAIGAQQLRVYTKYQGALSDLIDWTIRDLKLIAPQAERLGINILLENHEDFQGKAIATILSAVDHPNIRALYDYGNSQMVGEEPMQALDAMAAYITAVHMKDHVVLESNGETIIQGVPFGDGKLPIMQQTSRLYDLGLRRFCFENVWGYKAPLAKGYQRPDSPAFEIDNTREPFDAADLSQKDAIDQEMAAFHKAWSWFKSNLEREGYRIERDNICVH